MPDLVRLVSMPLPILYLYLFLPANLGSPCFSIIPYPLFFDLQIHKKIYAVLISIITKMALPMKSQDFFLKEKTRRSSKCMINI